jgi:hypothetical protein
MKQCRYHSTILVVSIPFLLAIAPSLSDAAVIHRWSFSETSGATVDDPIGGADGQILGDGWEWAGGQLRLPGGPSAVAPYVDLPNGIISKLTDATVEGWLTVDGAQSWARAFDFGSTDPNAADVTPEGEITDGPGGGANGQDYWMLSVSRGTNIDQQRHELRNLDPLFGGGDEGNVGSTQEILDTDIPSNFGEEYHFAAVYDSSGPELRTYRDGELMGTQFVSIELGNINDVNNWLGRSNWVNDSGFEGTFNEFRIYDEALDDDAVARSFAAGPNAPIGGQRVLQAGDADQDLDFDQLDLVRVQIAAKYLSGQAATWGEGDWNGAPGGTQGSPPPGNSRFDQADIIAALNANKYLMGPYAAIGPNGQRGDGQTSIVYDPRTGELAVDAPNNVQLTSVNIDSAGGVFTGAPSQNLGGSFDNDSDTNIFKATFGSSFGSLSFGNVAQPGLTQQFVLGDLTVVGSLAGGGALGNVDLIYIPEPAAATLMAMGVLALACIRRLRR